MNFQRTEMLARLEDHGGAWDMLIIGGGATGLGIAVDAASRGYDVLLLERGDFAKGTSSRSTKLVHGGIRYLQQGNVALVMEALKERGLLRQNAPHLVHDLAFVVPSYEWWESPFYGIGLKVYDLLAGQYGFGTSRHLSDAEVAAAIPTIEREGLRGGTLYFDGQFDDARLAIHLARTAAREGACLINYCEVTALSKDGAGHLDGAICLDHETGREHPIKARVVINACGPFCDAVRRMDQPECAPVIAPSQGVHLVLDRDFLPGDAAIMVPRTDDGRVLFALPWHQRVLLGTTDTPIPDTPIEPRAQEEEIDFILNTANRYLARDASRADVRSVFPGIRPLVRSQEAAATASLARDHSVLIEPASGLLTIAGGKWTTYRHMAEDAVNLAATLAGLPPRGCITSQLPIHGYDTDTAKHGPLAHYGSDAPTIQDLMRSTPEWAQTLHPDLPMRGAEVIWACREEMARTVEDVLSRRTRSLLFNAAAAMDVAERVAVLMADELGRDAEWVAGQVAEFGRLASGYRLG